jgi:tetratricopeptide (TPR) repeat protein
VSPRRLTISALTTCLALGALAADTRAASDADRQFTFAARLMQQGENQLAEQAFREFLLNNASDPRAGDVNYYLALLARRRGDLKAAQAHLQAAKNPVQVTADAVHLLAGQMNLETGDAKSAVAELEQVHAAALTDAESRSVWAYLLGTAYRATGNPAAAAKHFDQASEADSSVRGPALLELAKVQVELKQPEAAIEALTQATNTKLDADQAAEARGLAAGLCYQAQQYERAADLYRQIIQSHQTTAQFAPATIGLLRALYAAGQDDELIRQYEAIKKFLPPESQGEALYLVGASNIRLERFAAAGAPLLEFYKRFGATHPLSGEVAYLYAVVFYHTDLAGFEKWYASLEPELPKMDHRHELRFLRAQAAVKREKFADAIAFLTPLIDEPANPYRQRALIQRAALYEKLNQTDKAAGDYSRYVQQYGQDPKAAEAARRAIDLAFSGGQFPRVVELSEPWLKSAEAAKHDAADIAAVRFKLAVAQIKLNQLDAALANLDKVLATKPAEQLAAYTQLYRGMVLATQAKPAIDALTFAMRGSLPPEQQVEAMQLIAQLDRMANRDDQAIEMYEQLRRRQPMDKFETLTAMWVGRGLAQRNRPEDSLPWLMTVAGRKDASPEAVAESLYLAGQSYQTLGQWDSAIDAYRRLIAVGRGYADQGRLGLAQSLAGAGQVEEALEEYSGLINAEASRIAATALLESGLLRRDLAQRLERSGDKSTAAIQLDGARKQLSRVTILYDLPQLGTIPLRAQIALGVLAEQAGDRDKARQHFESITQRSPETPWHSVARAELLLLTGQRGDALFLFRKTADQGGDPQVIGYAKRRVSELGDRP